MIEGSCLCGKVRYEIDGSINYVSHCHCSMCRKTHGAAFATYGAAQRKELHWAKGEEDVASYRSSANLTRKFCRHCGSTLSCYTGEEPDVEYIALGTVDGDPGCRASSHIWVGSKAPWYTITDDLPCFDASDD